MTPAQSGGSSGFVPANHTAHTSTGPFMLTLCLLAPAVPIRPPEGPQLKRFKFFTTRVRQSDGSEQRYLHMGYFATLADARSWAQLMRGQYPSVIATPVPAALLRLPNSGIPTLAAAASPRKDPAVAAQNPPAEDPSLTDTQVLSILEARRVSPVQNSASEADSAHISLLRPEDTATRRILKEAVVQRAPVSFAVQLQGSEQPIDFSKVPSNSIFRAYTLYATQGHLEGRPVHCLRLGFFTDAISAKQVAYYVRSSFPAVAVVPVTEQERTRAGQTRIDPKTLSDSFQQQLDQLLDSDRGASDGAPAASAATTPAPGLTVKTSPSTPAPTSTLRTQSRPANDRGPAVARGHTETLEQTLELLAASEIWKDDSLS